MGLIAREIERAGIPTVTISVVRDASLRYPAPRNVFVAFRLGQVFGEPGAERQQRTVLLDTLAAFRQAREAGALVELPYRWRRSF
ncbi:MAG: hypothetical protein ACREMN_12140 [Gemmatimonadales bacterium]